jgi:hypothetical protein
MSPRIDLGAGLELALTACIGVTTRGIRAAHAMHKVPGGGGGGGARRGHSSVTAFRHGVPFTVARVVSIVT